MVTRLESERATRDSALQPVAERVALLDVMRGFALVGILVFNIGSLSGASFLRPGDAAGLAGHGGDFAVDFLTTALVESKFYSLFSLLFGVGFAVILTRCEAKGLAPTPYLRRRYVGLLAIGIIHTTLIWMGDILVLYALLGLVLILFRGSSNAALMRWSIGMLLAPIALYGIGLALMPPPAQGPGGLPPWLLPALLAFKTGSYGDVVHANVLFSAAQWMRRLILMFYPRVFGMFLLGFVLGRVGVFQRPERFNTLLTRLSVAGLVIGLPGGILFALLDTHAGFLPLTRIGWARTTVESIGTPLLTLGYAAWLTAAFATHAGRRIFSVLAPVGQAALSNYLLQSVIGIAIFYGIGAGFFMHVSITVATAIAICIYVAQVIIAHLWLSRFAFGPVEWIWRQITYGRAVALRRS